MVLRTCCLAITVSGSALSPRYRSIRQIRAPPQTGTKITLPEEYGSADYDAKLVYFSESGNIYDNKKGNLNGSALMK